MVVDALPVELGTLIEGKFRLTKEIGRGGMAAVFEAENVDIGKRVAVKVLSKELSHSKVVNERFIREARAAARIRSPYICDVFDVGTWDGLPYLVLELLEGESLYERLARERKLPIDETLRIAEQIAKGLQKAHDEKIVHRDLKPENIFLTQAEDGESVTKIVDFGLAKFYEPNAAGGAQARITKEGALFGTPAYMSPEQARAQGDVDHRADLWAFACIVYEMLIGRTVWNVDQGVAMILAQIASAPLPKPSRLRSDLPRTFDTWFEHALDRNIEVRFQSAKEAFDGLKVALLPPEGSVREASISSEDEGLQVDALVSGAPSTTQPVATPQAPAVQPSLPAPPRKGLRLGKLVFFSFLLAFFAGAAVAGTWVYQNQQQVMQWITLRMNQATSYLNKTQPRPKDEVAPVERAPFALQVNQAQETLRQGDAAKAKAEMEAAFALSKDKAARSLLNQLTTALANPGGTCRLGALGHPRPFDAASDSSIPSISVTTQGVVAVWADNHQHKDRRHAYATLLDSALRRVYPALSVTPEARGVIAPQLAQAGGQLALAYWDNAGDQPGVYVRPLEPDGRLAGGATLLSSSVPGIAYNPTLAADPDGTFWVVWSDGFGQKPVELVALHLSASLKPLGDKVRLTAHPANTPSVATVASVAVGSNSLSVAFRVQRGNQFELLLLRNQTKSPEFAAGVQAAQGTEPSYLGDVVKLSSEATKHTVPQLTCIDAGCFVGWDAENVGAQLGFVKQGESQLAWFREISSKSSRPSVASSGSKAVACWYEEGKVKAGMLTVDGVAEGAVVARASGTHPSTEIRPSRDGVGTHETHWYLAWRDYEGGEDEPFVARVDCK
ncbi:MAG TPA: serine/threonine-protein kinase [Polyangiaceae bacterium]|nr:serine/threonine-protein kinase [Polyangiaceae bacterium]